MDLAGAERESLRGNQPGGRTPPEPLVSRYRPEHLSAFTDEELRRFLGPLSLTGRRDAELPDNWPRVRRALAWELLYRVEPELFERLVAGEPVHPAILDWFPARLGSVVETGAGGGRLTLELAPRAERYLATEPAAPLREILRRKLAARGLGHVEVREGFFDRLPAPDCSADLVVSCSAFTVDPAHGGERGLAEFLRVVRPGGLVTMVWPDDSDWLAARGFQHVTVPGGMAVRFASAEEAVELARVFYPDAAALIERRGSAEVPFDVLGINAPRDLCFLRVPEAESEASR